MPAGLGLYGLWQSAHGGFAKSRTSSNPVRESLEATASLSAGVPVQGVACIA